MAILSSLPLSSQTLMILLKKNFAKWHRHEICPKKLRDSCFWGLNYKQRVYDLQQRCINAFKWHEIHKIPHCVSSVPLLLFRSLSSTIFPCLSVSLSGVGVTLPKLHFFNIYIMKADMLHNDPVPLRINQYHFILTQYHQVLTIGVLYWVLTQYTLCTTQLHNLVTHSWANWI